MRITIQMNHQASEWYTNLVQSDNQTLGEEEGTNICTFETLGKLYDLMRNWPTCEYIAVPVDGKMWSFNPANIARMCIVLTKPEEDAFNEWLEKHNAK